jgi:hypothetical protein
MAIQIKTRNSSAATWGSVNPVPAQGELITVDSSGFKIGDGSSAYNSLSFQGQTGPAQTQPYRSLGDGSDGNVVISAGTTTLVRDMYYNNLTINGTGALNTAEYKIFVKGILDLTAAPQGAIQDNGLSGNNASGTTGGAAPSASASGSLGGHGNGGAGANSSTGAGSAGSTGGSITGNGGTANVGGAGGAGSNAAGAGGAGGTLTALLLRRYTTNFLRGATVMGGGVGGGGGGSGGGDGTNAGGAGGSGGQGGGAIVIYANIILKSANTQPCTISSMGGMGGNGSNSAQVGITGGGGGGAGGAGGWVVIFYNVLAGPTAVNAICCESGAGGQGGNGYGFIDGATAGKGGAGGGACNAGRVTLYNIPTGVCYDYNSTQIIGGGINPELNGSPAVGVQGGAGGKSQFFRISL